MMSAWPWAAIGSWTLHVLVVGGLSLRVISKCRPPGVSLAWLVVLASFPIAGAVLYVFVGEAWLSGRRSRRAAVVAETLREPVRMLRERAGAEVSSEHQGAQAVAKLGDAELSPTLGGNAVEILDGATGMFDRLVADIDAAQHSCDMLYYI